MTTMVFRLARANFPDRGRDSNPALLKRLIMFLEPDAQSMKAGLLQSAHA
jgi:hypothetical protein